MSEEKEVDLRELMYENVKLLAIEYFNIVLVVNGTREYASEHEDRIINAFEKIMHKLPILKVKGKVDSTHDVLKLLGEDKLTIDEAKEIIKIIGDAVEIEELPKLREALEKVGG